MAICEGQVLRATFYPITLLVFICSVLYMFLYLNIGGVVKQSFVPTSRKLYIHNNLNFSIDSGGRTLISAEYNETLLNAIVQNKSEYLLTLFTTWVHKEPKYLVHNNTVRNWSQLKPFVKLVVYTNDTDVASYCSSHGWHVLPITKIGAGIPVLNNMYQEVIAKFNSSFYAYSNSDILYTESLIRTLIFMLDSVLFNQTLFITGRRTNVGHVSTNDAKSFQDITAVARSRGQVFSVVAEDYFITTRTYPWNNMPPLVVGRRAYDNWLVLNARTISNSTVDATETILAVHQTTSAGNFEGHSKRNADINVNILQKLYKRIQFTKGRTSCCAFATKYENSSVINLIKRELPKYCKIT